MWDSPNSAGIIIDAIRAAKIAKDRGLGGPILPASAYLMKSPPVQMADDKARAELEAFISEACGPGKPSCGGGLFIRPPPQVYYGDSPD